MSRGQQPPGGVQPAAFYSSSMISLSIDLLFSRRMRMGSMEGRGGQLVAFSRASRLYRQYPLHPPPPRRVVQKVSSEFHIQPLLEAGTGQPLAKLLFHIPARAGARRRRPRRPPRGRPSDRTPAGREGTRQPPTLPALWPGHMGIRDMARWHNRLDPARGGRHEGRWLVQRAHALERGELRRHGTGTGEGGACGRGDRSGGS